MVARPFGHSVLADLPGDGQAKLLETARLRQLEPDGITAEDIRGTSPEALEACDILLLGSSTWGFGDLPGDWAAWEKHFADVSLTGKHVAVFGCGDSHGFADSFCDAMRTLHDAAQARGAIMIGAWPLAAYDATESRAVLDDQFIGMAIDEDNQPELTDERNEAWCTQLVAELQVQWAEA